MTFCKAGDNGLIEMRDQQNSLIWGTSMAASTMSSVNWAEHALGESRDWPEALKALLGVVYRSVSPTFLLWDQDSYCFYNDSAMAYLDADVKPGFAARLSMPRIWPLIQPEVQWALQKYEASAVRDRRFFQATEVGARETFWNYDCTPILLSTGEVGGVLVQLTETTHQIEAFRSLNQSQATLHKALAAGQLGAFEIRMKTQEMNTSPTFNEIVGKEPSVPYLWSDFIRQIQVDDGERLVRNMEDSIAEGRAFNCECRLLMPDSSIQWIGMIGQSVRDENDRVIAISGLVQRITEKKLEVETLADKLAEYKRANSRKSAFLADMSHEIRNPLGAMLGFAELLKDSNLSDQDRSDYIGILTRNGQQLAVVINDILDYSKVEAGQLAFSYGPTDPRALALDVTSLLKIRCEEKRIGLRLEVAPTLRSIFMTDAIRLKQILLNIIGNAVKFTSQGEVVVRVFEQDANVAFEVSDTGIGIAPRAVKRLFAEYAQADDSIAHRFGGTGLGLALSRRLARALGGDLRLTQSQAEQGTTFLILIPERSELTG